jgi:hypothetical protein
MQRDRTSASADLDPAAAAADSDATGIEKGRRCSFLTLLRALRGCCMGEARQLAEECARSLERN